MKSTILWAGLALATLSAPAMAATLAGVGTYEGDVGIGTANGVVTASPLGSSYVYLTTNTSNASSGLGVAAETSGSVLTTNAFSAAAGEILKLSFNYITSDGAGFSDYAYVILNDLGNNTKLTLFTARTTPTGNTVPGTGLPSLAPGVTLNPGSTPITAGAPSWSELGGDTGRCFSAGCGYTGWIEALYTLGSGTYSMTFGVVNNIDNGFDSGLAVAGLKVGTQTIVNPNVSAVPLPASAPLLLAGLAAVAALRRRKS